MTGQQAYEMDIQQRPLYHDGTRRNAWDNLCEIARLSWGRNPTPRNWTKGAPHEDDRDGGRTIMAGELA